MKIGIEIERPVFRKGKPVTLPWLQHDKEAPLVVDGNAYHKDASMLEIAMRPANSVKELVALAAEADKQAKSLLPTGHTMRFMTAVEYADAELEADPYASEMGCSPSMCIHEGTPETPEAFADNVRYGGCHVNIETTTPAEVMTLALDCVLGLFSVINFESDDPESHATRRRCYGRAGEYRPRDFGVEYRTLPNVAASPKNLPKVWALTEYAASIDPVQAGWVAFMERVADAINTSDREAAEQLVTELHPEGLPC